MIKSSCWWVWKLFWYEKVCFQWLYNFVSSVIATNTILYTTMCLLSKPGWCPIIITKERGDSIISPWWQNHQISCHHNGALFGDHVDTSSRILQEPLPLPLVAHARASKRPCQYLHEHFPTPWCTLAIISFNKKIMKFFYTNALIDLEMHKHHLCIEWCHSIVPTYALPMWCQLSLPY